MSRTVEKRIEKLEDEASPQRFMEIRIIGNDQFPTLLPKNFTIRVPIKKKKR